MVLNSISGSTRQFRILKLRQKGRENGNTVGDGYIMEEVKAKEKVRVGVWRKILYAWKELNMSFVLESR